LILEICSNRVDVFGDACQFYALEWISSFKEYLFVLFNLSFSADEIYNS